MSIVKIVVLIALIPCVGLIALWCLTVGRALVCVSRDERK